MGPSSPIKDVSWALLFLQNMSNPMLHLIYYSYLVFAKDGVRGFYEVKQKGQA